MKILITGSTGFIGSNLLNHIDAENNLIFAVKRTKDSVPRVKLQNKEINWIHKDFADLRSNELEGIDLVIHLASHSTNVPYDSLTNCLTVNVLNQTIFLENAINAGIKNFIIAGSCFEYGLSSLDYDFIPPNAELKPVGSYAVSKALGFTALKELFRNTSCRVEYLRIFHVYGEGELNSRLWPSLKYHAENGLDMNLTSGEQIRDFIHVNKVCENIINRIDMISRTDQKASFIISNIGTGKPQSLKNFCNYWWEKWNANGKLHFGRIPYREDEIFRFVPLVNED